MKTCFVFAGAFWIWLIPVSVFSQDLDYVNSQVDTLSSPAFFGRGYINDGSNLAADYLAAQFEKLRAKPVSESYFQPFIFKVNTFPKKSIVSCNGNTLVEGYDYLINPGSGSSHGKYKTVFLDSTSFQNSSPTPKKRKAIPVIDLTGIDTPDEVSLLHDFKIATLRKSPIIVLNPKKIMWSVSPQRYKNSLIEIEKGKFCTDSRKVGIDVQNAEIEYEARNIIGKISGESSDSCLVITAHYDHLGMMGNAMFPGASDNASGTAMLLDLMRFYAENKPQQDIYFISFAAEEAGLIGSKYFVDNPLFDLSKIKFLVNLDLMGSAAEGITLVNGSLFPERMRSLAAINTQNEFLPKIKLRGKAANSDHYWFSEAGVPAVFIYTLGNAKAYHDVYDVPSGLDWANYNELFTLLVTYLDTL
ncbi:Zn-dependent exopeptidase M28 [Cryomorpha ignava]|uniref:Zn-dependent exopeptidase M28 n=1 Tax=Cryomorpha ignava TaxID=101383 RepID=A0A7K3WRP3_9FLAO|nr:M28 family metallopeptidase [Cryomorpha ignava]NEN23512.1 Zn-dependent exopeptidase M28 [Cryomorpha ignava]